MAFKVTDIVLDKLGFSKYHDGSGDYGTRTLKISEDNWIAIIDYDEKDDETDGYADWGTYQPKHYGFVGYNQKVKIEGVFEEILILEDIHRIIKDYFKEYENDFILKCKELRMEWGLIDAAERYKPKTDK